MSALQMAPGADWLMDDVNILSWGLQAMIQSQIQVFAHMDW